MTTLANVHVIFLNSLLTRLTHLNSEEMWNLGFKSHTIYVNV